MKKLQIGKIITTALALNTMLKTGEALPTALNRKEMCMCQNECILWCGASGDYNCCTGGGQRCAYDACIIPPECVITPLKKSKELIEEKVNFDIKENRNQVEFEVHIEVPARGR